MSGRKKSGENGHFVTELPVDDDGGDNSPAVKGPAAGHAQAQVQRAMMQEIQQTADQAPPVTGSGTQITARESEYQQKRLERALSPPRADPFALSTPAEGLTTYKEIMENNAAERENAELRRKIQKMREEKGDTQFAADVNANMKAMQNGSAPGANKAVEAQSRKRNRWDTPTEAAMMDTPDEMGSAPGQETPDMNAIGATPEMGAWGETPASIDVSKPKRKRARWDETPGEGEQQITPAPAGGADMATPVSGGDLGATPDAAFMGTVGTPVGLTPDMMTPDQLQQWRFAKEIDERNRPMTDAELDEIFPPGYEIVQPPANYAPARKNVFSAPTPGMAATPGFMMPGTPSTGDGMTQDSGLGELHGVTAATGDMPEIKAEDRTHFAPLLAGDDDDDLAPEEAKERKIMKLLLQIKNGEPAMRRRALKEITNKAREFGAGPLFNQILPLMMSSTLEEQERHLLVKIIDRVLHRLDDLVRPYVHKILVVVEPLLIDEDYYARVEGREVIANLSKAAGLPTMIATMRPDIDHVDEYVRNTTARAFAVVASALGIPALLMFLKAVCNSKKSWQGRHTGIKIIQQIAILLGIAILPHLKQMVDIIAPGLSDEQRKVRTMTALALAALAEAATPYGIEAFDSVLRPLWKGILEARDKDLAAFLKAIGYIVPLMDADHANHYTREVMIILIREFSTADDEMKKIVLKVVHQCVATEGVESNYIREEVLQPFFRNFWVARMALDRRNYRQLVDTTVEIATKVGGAEVVGKIIEDLKDGNELYRKMVMETIDIIVQNLGVADFDSRLEELLVDGIIYAFQEQSTEDTTVMLNGCGAVINSLGTRVKPYLPQVAGIVRWRLNTPNPKVRQQAADLIARIAGVMKQCGEEQMLGHFGIFLYQYLGEEYPDVLGSILGALKAIVNVIGMNKMTPPIKDLLPRLTPILKNRHEKVQENVIDLVGRIADRGAELAPPREWNRICFDVLELLKAQKKAIRRASVNTFGYIARAIGPHDVLSTLLNNLRVQERQLRVCTTVAIGIVAETCNPFTVLPAMMNEYKQPDLNVQHGILKSLSFMFEYIGEMAKDYIYAVTPLLEDALQDRDAIHRQQAIFATTHLTLGVYGMNCEDAIIHLMNFVWPNLFESTPHLIQGVYNCIDAFRTTLGPTRILQYLMQGLFHPARRVREVYWKLYNNMYIGAQEALVPSFPKLPEPEYHRCDLEMML
ncbi:unnamed protein product [Amoebophrya sp. A120]|nr:unnamed protein product [Amoebophrya sp. A120]|eukprot:GSA120T00005385001.1